MSVNGSYKGNTAYWVWIVFTQGAQPGQSIQSLSARFVGEKKKNKLFIQILAKVNILGIIVHMAGRVKIVRGYDKDYLADW